MKIPETRYATAADGVRIAYQTIGDGPVDLVYVPGWISHIGLMWEQRDHANFLQKLASFSRLLVFDKRGTGLSDRVAEDDLPDLETRMGDIRAVMDAAGMERAMLLGHSEGACLCLLFAATYPGRVPGLLLFEGDVRGRWSPKAPWGITPQEFDEEQLRIEKGWDSGEYHRAFLEVISPSKVGDEGYLEWMTRYFRSGASAAAAMTLNRIWFDTDVSMVLGAITVPTLVIWRAKNPWAEEHRFAAAHIPVAKAVELNGIDHMPWVGDDDALVKELAAFVEEVRHEEAALERVLATVLFTDIVGSTERAAELGDRKWRELLDGHNASIRALLTRFGGREVDTAGDGFFATFDGPARAIRCAGAATQAIRSLGIEIRAGVHTGELDSTGPALQGIAVHIGARVAAIAGPSEVLVSQTVKDLVAGSGLQFDDAGEHELKGVPDRWRLYRVVGL